MFLYPANESFMTGNVHGTYKSVSQLFFHDYLFFSTAVFLQHLL